MPKPSSEDKSIYPKAYTHTHEVHTNRRTSVLLLPPACFRSARMTRWWFYLQQACHEEVVWKQFHHLLPQVGNRVMASMLQLTLNLEVLSVII